MDREPGDTGDRLGTERRSTSEFSVRDLPGVGSTIAQKLAECGYDSVESLAMVAPRILADRCGLGEKTSEKITFAAWVALGGTKMTTGYDLKEQCLNRIFLSTNSAGFDELLGGGLEPGRLTEVFGEYRTGKTQLCHQLCVNVQLPPGQGGLGGSAVYIDTENNFSPERIIQMAEAKGLDADDILRHIIVMKAHNSNHQILHAKNLISLIPAQNIKLVVVDNVIEHFRAEFIGRGMAPQRQAQINMHLHDLKRIGASFSDTVVVFTNQTVTKPDVFFGDPTKAAGGSTVASAANIRLYLRKGKGEQRVVKVIAAPHLPDGEAVFVLIERGIEDPDF